MFSDSELSRMRKTQEESMMWECAIEAYSLINGVPAYAEAILSICGFQIISRVGGNGAGAFYETIEADAELRLPLSVSIGMRDRVTLLKQFGKELTPARVYEVIKLPDSFGPSGQVVSLKEVYN